MGIVISIFIFEKIYFFDLTFFPYKVVIREGLWSRDGAVVRALASHQCGPGSIQAWCHTCTRCWLSLLLALALLQGIFSMFSGFPPFTKTNISKFQFDQLRG